MAITSIGILGGGQLGSLLSLATKKLNINTSFVVKDKFNCFTESYEPDVYTFKMLKERFQFSKTRFLLLRSHVFPFGIEGMDRMVEVEVCEAICRTLCSISLLLVRGN